MTTASLDLSHLNALEMRLSHERERLNNAKTDDERKIRAVWVNGIEKEIADELKFLGVPEEAIDSDATDDELLKELFS